MLKVLMGSFFISLLATNSFAENCMVSDALKNKSCSAEYFRARNQRELDDYLLSGKFKAGKLLNLEIGFNVKEKEINIATSCDLKISREKGLFAKQNGICLKASSVRLEGENELVADKQAPIDISALNSVILRRSSLETRGDLSISTSNFLPFDGEILISRESSLKARNIHINSKSNLLINSESKLKADDIVLNGGNCEINEKNDRDNDDERDHDRSCRKFKPLFAYTGTCTSNPLPINLKIVPTVNPQNALSVSFKVLGSPTTSLINWKFDNTFKSIAAVSNQDFIYPGKHLVEAVVFEGNGYFRKFGQYLNVSPKSFNKDEIAIFQFIGSKYAPKQIQASIDMKKLMLVKSDQDPELYFAEITDDKTGIKNILIPYFNYQEKFTLNILPVISNVNSYIDQRFEYFKSSISDLPINNDLNNMNEGILYALNEIRVKVDALSPSDKMVFAQTLQANLSANIPITVLNSSKARKNNTFDPLKLIFNEANASDISVTNKMRNFVIVGIISIKYAVPAIQKGALLIKTSKSTPKRLAGAALIVGGLATIALFIYTEWDILEGLNFLDAETITFNVLGSSAYADEPINIKLKGIFRPINPILDSNSKSSLIKNTINTYNNANTFLLSIDNILSSVNGAMANLSIISPLPEKTQKLKFDQKTVESNLSPKFITSAIVISPLDGSASVSIQPNVGVVIKSNKSQLVKVRLMYDNINLAITKSIDVVLPVVATEIIVPKAIIHYTKNNLQVNFDSADPVSPNISGLTFFWSFGDGQNQTTTSKNISHNYSHEGNYVVTLTVTNASGASANSQANVQVASPIDVSPIPHATIAYSTYKYQANFDATDSQNSAVVGISYQWDYGDGNSETFPVPTVTHYYQNAGKYNVTLKAIDYFGKTATVTRSVLIAGELPVISHTTAGREVTFTLTDSLNIAEMGAIYKWTFSDGESLSTTSKQVIHLFPDLLGKIISVELFDENSTLIYSITDTLPDRSHSNLSYVIINRNVKFNLESILGYDNEPGITYSWDFGDGNQGTSLGTSIVHTYFNEGTYHVTVNVFDKNGNLLFNETTFVLVDQSNQSINAQAVLADGTSGEAYLISLFSPTSKIGFNYQYDSLYEGTCYVKGFVYFTSSLDGKQVVSAPLYNCTANDLILTNN